MQTTALKDKTTALKDKSVFSISFDQVYP